MPAEDDPDIAEKSAELRAAVEHAQWQQSDCEEILKALDAPKDLPGGETGIR